MRPLFQVLQEGNLHPKKYSENTFNKKLEMRYLL